MKKLVTLIFDLAVRQIVLKYRGSFFGIFWSIITPLLMITAYSLVFGEIFQSKWGSVDAGMSFPLLLFSGLIVFNLFSECLQRSPYLIIENPNYVKKVSFPLEVLPIVMLLVSLFNAIVSMAIWLLFYIFFIGIPHAEVALILLVLMPSMLLSLGVGWLFSSAGVYLRDVGQSVGFITTILLFLSPIFYPISAVPEDYQWVVGINPIGFSVETVRELMFFGKLPDWSDFMLYFLKCTLFSGFSFFWFQRVRKGFADVV